MLYLRICFDKAGMSDQRNAKRQEHREYLVPFLEPGQDVLIREAGPMCVEDGESNLGSFLIVEADSIEAVQKFHDNDPFSKAGVFGDVRLVRWDKHIENRINEPDASGI